MQMLAGILQRPRDRGTEHVARHPHNEQLSESGIKYEFRRDPAVATTENSGVGLLALRQLGQHFLLHRREAGLPREKARIPLLQTGQGFRCGIPRRRVAVGLSHRYSLSESARSFESRLQGQSLTA